MKKGFLSLSIIASAILATGCVDAPSEENDNRETEVNGRVVISPISNSEIEIINLENGTETTILHSTISDATGSFDFNSVIIPNKTHLIKATGGQYEIPVTESEPTSFNNSELKAYVNIKPGDEYSIALTPFSNLVSGLIEYRLKSESTSEISKIVQESYAALNGQFNFDAQIDLPCIASCIDSNEGSELHRLFVEALINFSEFICEENLCTPSVSEAYSPSALSDLMYRDIRDDGKLDGKALNATGTAEVSLAMGNYFFTTNSYRNDFAHALLRAKSTQFNDSYLGLEKVVQIANSLATAQSSLFSEEPNEPLDQEDPTITTNVSDLSSVKGQWTIDVSSSDNIGIASLSVLINGVEVEKTDSADLQVNINTFNYPDGELSVKIVAVDLLGNESSQSSQVNVSNYSPIVELKSNDLINNGLYTAVLDISPSDNAIEKVLYNQQNLNISDLSNVTASVSLNEGNNTFSVEVIDENNASYMYSFTIGLDTKTPTLQFIAPFDDSVEVFDSVGNLVVWDISETLIVASHNKSLGQIAPTIENLSNLYFGYATAAFVDPDSNGLSTPTDELALFYTVVIDGEIAQSRKSMNILNNGFAVIPLEDNFLTEGWAGHPSENNLEVIVEVEDKAGNIATETLAFKAQLKPLDTSNSLVEDTWYTGILEVELFGDQSEVTSAELSIGTHTFDFVNSKTTLGTQIITSGLYDAKVSLTGLFENTDFEDTRIGIDNTKPAIILTDSAPFTNASSITLSATVKDENSGLASVKFDSLLGNKSGDTYSKTVNLGSTNGFHYVDLVAIDNVGISDDKTYSIRLDTQAPTGSITNSSSWANITNVSVKGTCDDPKKDNYRSWFDSITIKLNGKTKNAVCSQAQNDANTYSGLITSVSNGTHTASVVFKDKAGNSTTVSKTIKIDRVAPTVSNLQTLAKSCPAPNGKPVGCTETFTWNLNITEAHSGVNSISPSDASCAVNLSNESVSCTKTVGFGDAEEFKLKVTIKDNAGHSVTSNEVTYYLSTSGLDF